MTTGGSLPRPEDFGIDGGAFERAPSLIIAPRLGLLCTGILISLGVVAVAVMSWTTGSASAAIIFAPIFVVASLVLVLPLIVGCLGLAGKLEERWRSARDPHFRAWLCYRRALAEWEAKSAEPSRLARQAWWLHISPEQLRALAPAAVAGEGSVEELDRQTDGADFLVRARDRVVVVRCETGLAPAAASVARELAMVRLDLGADEAVLVAPAGGTPALRRYLEKHPIRLLDAGALEALEPASNLRR